MCATYPTLRMSGIHAQIAGNAQTLAGLVALAATTVQVAPVPTNAAPALEVARDAGAERWKEPAVRLSGQHQWQLPRLPDGEGVRADQRSRVARQLSRLFQCL